MSSKTATKEASATKPVDPVPNGMHTVTPHLVCAGAAEAIDFYVKAFGATDICRVPGQDGKLMHAMIGIGDSLVMLVDEMPDFGILGPKAKGGSSVTIHLQVKDSDALFDQAVKAGAKVVMPITEQFWGDRYGVVEDPCGHQWSIATHVRDVSPEELQKAAASACCGESCVA
ncbi:putative glyoxalase superfamily protein PhnB [Roseimicrobium gellanilyticum]|uniref:Putative glyoxalase superfamily protein PhnB n=1 Tax=Roseimicrobium gellanilyticum TaxID=748857 RepID=A0A366HRG4_9BACT|nr:VOC family protein [Roseimicrobium gellanilyticum]RBP46086.1 putative glyoxalase superfamily protein PhnB [Roseimicrobium gellanilyticum]